MDTGLLGSVGFGALIGVVSGAASAMTYNGAIKAAVGLRKADLMSGFRTPQGAMNWVKIGAGAAILGAGSAAISWYEN